MTPTNKLRFVQRDMAIPIQSYPDGTKVSEIKPVRILQQYWVPAGGDKTSDHYKGEWRDVPLEEE